MIAYPLMMSAKWIGFNCCSLHSLARLLTHAALHYNLLFRKHENTYGK